MPMPTKYALDEHFSYNPETGELRWKFRPMKHFASKQAWETHNLHKVDTIAGETHFQSEPLGTLKVRVEGQRYSVPTIVQLMHNGEYQPNLRNNDGNPWNNHLDNLTLTPAVALTFPLNRRIQLTPEGIEVRADGVTYGFDKQKQATYHANHSGMSGYDLESYIRHDLKLPENQIKMIMILSQKA